jgi:hypothetical protein
VVGCCVCSEEEGVTGPHLPIGHFSVAIRSFAHVEHPHFLHLPVPINPELSQNSHDLHISNLSFNILFDTI